MANKAKIVDDLSPRMKELIKDDKPVAWGKNKLDTNREPFSPEEREIAGRIGTPEQGGAKK